MCIKAEEKLNKLAEFRMNQENDYLFENPEIPEKYKPEEHQALISICERQRTAMRFKTIPLLIVELRCGFEFFSGSMCFTLNGKNLRAIVENNGNICESNVVAASSTPK